MKNIFNCIFFITGICWSINMYPQQNKQKDFEFGIGTGVLLTGKIDVGELPEKLKLKPSICLKGYADVFETPKFAWGVYLSYASVGIKENDYLNMVLETENIDQLNMSAMELGGAIKTRFVVNEKISFKPALEFGYRRFFSNFDMINKSHGVAANVNCELQYAFTDKLKLFGALGFVSQPYGGKEHVTYLDFYPILTIMAGVVF